MESSTQSDLAAVDDTKPTIVLSSKETTLSKHLKMRPREGSQALGQQMLMHLTAKEYQAYTTVSSHTSM